MVYLKEVLNSMFQNYQPEMYDKKNVFTSAVTCPFDLFIHLLGQHIYDYFPIFGKL